MVFGVFKWISRLFVISIIGFFSTIYMYNAKAANPMPVKVSLSDGNYKVAQVDQLNFSNADKQKLAANIKYDA